MKKIKIAFLSLLATCTIASCDFLEKEPYKIVPENYFQNEAEAQSFLTGIYSNLGQSTFYGGDTWFLQAVMTWSFMEGLPDVFPIQD